VERHRLASTCKDDSSGCESSLRVAEAQLSQIDGVHLADGVKRTVMYPGFIEAQSLPAIGSRSADRYDQEVNKRSKTRGEKFEGCLITWRTKGLGSRLMNSPQFAPIICQRCNPRGHTKSKRRINVRLRLIGRGDPSEDSWDATADRRQSPRYEGVANNESPRFPRSLRSARARRLIRNCQ